MRPLFTYTMVLMVLSVVACKSRKDVAEEVMPIPQVDTAVVAVPETSESPVEKSEVIYYERTVCFGTCPSFVFTVESDGSCVYKGRNFVDMIGTYKGSVTEEQINTIRLQALALGYDTLQARYDQPMVSDLPSTITAIDGKRVLNRYHGPDLSRLYARLDSLILKVKWEDVESNKQ